MCGEYGLRCKREIWRVQLMLSKVRKVSNLTCVWWLRQLLWARRIAAAVRRFVCLKSTRPKPLSSRTFLSLVFLLYLFSFHRPPVPF